LHKLSSSNGGEYLILGDVQRCGYKLI
jgi:hypothetical protein